jgi:hypothetical protein
MPLYVDFYILLVKKSAVRAKYPGGLEQFRADYAIGSSEVNEEDDELFSLGQMNPYYDIDALTDRGLAFDDTTKHSEDFTILPRYGDLFWEAPWVAHNRVFAWHVDTDPQAVQRVMQISEMSLDEIGALQEKGAKPFAPIRKPFPHDFSAQTV